jgi:hypothetical protein
VVATALTTQQVVDLQRDGILPQPPPPPPKQVGSTDYQAWKQHQQQHQVLQQQQLLELLQKHQMEQQQQTQQQKQQVMVQHAEQAQLLHLQALDTSNEELLQLQPMQLVDLSQQRQLQQMQVQQMQVAQHQQQPLQQQLLQLQGASVDGLRQTLPQELIQGSGMGVWSVQPIGHGASVAGGQEQQQVAVQNTPQTLEEAYAWVMAKNGSGEEPQLQRQQGVQLVQLVGVQDGMRAHSDQLAMHAQQQQHQQHQQLTMLQRLMQAGASPELEEAVLKLHSM